MTRFVLDSYAILAVIRQELAAAPVERLLNERANEHWMSTINVGEVYYRTVREYGPQTAQGVMEWLDRLSIRFSDATLHRVLSASVIKSRYRLSYADCFGVELAKQLDAKLITGDPEFEQLERDGVIAIEWVPVKPKRSR